MENQKESKSTDIELYPVHEEPVVLSKHLFDLLLQQEKPDELIALYNFYYYTAKWQKTNQPKATAKYIMNGLKWTREKFSRAKASLLSLQLIEDVIDKDEIGKIIGHYVKIKFIWNKIHPMENPEYGKSDSVENPQTNALNPNRESISSLKKNKIVPKLFDRFWHIYPKKVGKGDALSTWLKICSRKEEPPTWEQVMNAVIKQIKTPQWQKKELIPNPATWLNGRKWLNDPEGMILYDREKESNTCPFNFIFGKDFDEYSGCVTCEEKHNKVFEQCRIHQK